ncbi:hypothetical protein B4110_0407 [Parageobacillus toebii]|uniref:Uncharacterized protein n=1 Tax=Parageobacillus toebii TaxID=153151 RepID=A0A150MAJ6_9BACL|nr:hypothetical protein B4110_0407 [Parageobacillus toebii]
MRLLRTFRYLHSIGFRKGPDFLFPHMVSYLAPRFGVTSGPNHYFKEV